MKPCPCWDNDFSKCLYPGTPWKSKIQTNFKDEPETFLEYTSCNFKHYYGPYEVEINKMTRQEYNNMIEKFTYCSKEE